MNERDALRADQHRDSLADLYPVPKYSHRPITREQLNAAIFGRASLIPCGAQLDPQHSNDDQGVTK